MEKKNLTSSLEEGEGMGKKGYRPKPIEPPQEGEKLYILCEYVDPKKTRQTGQHMRVWVTWCSLKCRHKCKEFISIPEPVISEQLNLLVEEYGDKYLGDIESFEINRKIYKRCVLCKKECKKMGVGILMSCSDFRASGRQRVTKALKDEARRILNSTEDVNRIVEKKEEEKPRKRGRGRPKGSTKKKMEEENGKKQRGKKSTKKKTGEKKKGKETKKKETRTKETSKKTRTKRTKKKSSRLVKGKVKSIRKARGKNLYRLTLQDGQKFEPSGVRSSINKDLEFAKDLWGKDIRKCNVKIEMKNNKMNSVDFEE